MPAVRDRLVDRRDAILKEGRTVRLELRERLRDGQVVLREDGLVVGHDPVIGTDHVPDLGAVELPADGRLRSDDRIEALDPRLVAQVNRVGRGVVSQLHVGDAGLAQEEVHALSGLKLGGKDIEVLGGRDDLEVEVDAGLLLEPAGKNLLG